VTWRLEPNALAALRDTLLERGRALEHGRALTPLKEPSLDGSPAAATLLRRVAPFLELLYLMMVTDGKCDERERQLLQGVTQTLGGSELPCGAAMHLLTVFDANLEAEGVDGRLETVSSVLCADRLDAEAAFTLTATMAVADGEVEAPEHEVLARLAEMLGISAKRARELIAQRPLGAHLRSAP
jgi:tellurite resistance protein